MVFINDSAPDEPKLGPPVSTFWLSRHQVPSSRVLYFFPMGAPLSILPLPPPLTPSVGLICYFLNASNLSFPTLATDLWLTPTSKVQWLEAQSLISLQTMFWTVGTQDTVLARDRAGRGFSSYPSASRERERITKLAIVAPQSLSHGAPQVPRRVFHRKFHQVCAR